MTPADELRTAAETLRALATAASTDPHSNRPTTTWEFKPRNPEFPTDFPAHGTLTTPDNDGRNRNLIHGRSPGGRAPSPWMFEAHGAYIAAMDPGVGRGLAEWLDTEAATWAGDEVHNRCSSTTCTLDAALAVARAILGSQP